MTNDVEGLIERLRAFADAVQLRADDAGSAGRLCEEAAARLETLEAVAGRMLGILDGLFADDKGISNPSCDCRFCTRIRAVRKIRKAARAAGVKEPQT